MSKQGSYFVVVPSPVRLCRDTPEGAKLLYGDIAGLADKHGYCFASDEYLSDIAGKTSRQVNTYLKRLEKNGHIRIEGRVPERKIYVGEMKVSSKVLKKTAERNEENFNDTIYTNTDTNTITKDVVRKYFVEEKHLALSVADSQAEAFLEYHNESGNLKDGKYRARAHQWYKRGIEWGTIVDPGRGVQASEITNPDTGLIDTSRWERRGNKYFRRS
jgi:hypothetical protein